MHDQKPKLRLSIADRWILSSLMQKAVRRGDKELAVSAWEILSPLDSKRAWRRIMLTAFEDIGIGDLAAVIEATTTCSSEELNEASGRHLVRLLAMARKDRSIDYLFCGCIRHPSLELERLKMERASDHERLIILGAPAHTLESRAMAAIVLMQRSEGGRGFGRTRGGTVRAIVERLTDDAVLRATIETAFRKSGEPFLLMLPLLLESGRSRNRLSSKAIAIPPTKYVDGLPMYALDKHTRVGRAAIREFVADNDNVRRCLQQQVAPRDFKAAAYMAAYYTDATLTANRFVWSQSDSLEITGREADMYSAGVPLEGVTPILEVFQRNLVHLDEIRARLFRKKFSGGDL